MTSDIHFKVDSALAERWANLKSERSEKSRWLRRLTRLLVKAFEQDKLDEFSVMVREVERRLEDG